MPQVVKLRKPNLTMKEIQVTKDNRESFNSLAIMAKGLRRNSVDLPMIANIDERIKTKKRPSSLRALNYSLNANGRQFPRLPRLNDEG